MIYQRIYIMRKALRDMIAECIPHVGNETGGVLCGFVMPDGDGVSSLVITQASSGGPNAVRRPDAFQRDTVYCQKFVDEQAAASGGRADYVGEWHKHPSLNLHLSPMDVTSLREVESSPNYATDQPVLILVAMPDEAKYRDHQLAAFTCWGGDAVSMMLEVAE